MKGYWLILGNRSDHQAAQGEYSRLSAPIAEKYRARLNPTKVPPLLKEARNTVRVIIAEFPSYEMAKGLLRGSGLIREPRQFALRASKRDLLILEGVLE